jgi:hypothetical protein
MLRLGERLPSHLPALFANAGLLGQQTAWHMLTTHARQSATPIEGKTINLVVSPKEAREGGRGQHVADNLYVVRSHLLVSFVLGRPP